MSNVTQRKSICFVAGEFIQGGVEKVLVDTILRLHHHYNITLVCLLDYVDQGILQQLPEDVEVIICKGKGSLANLVLYSLPVVGGLMINSKLRHKKRFDYMISLKPQYLMASFSNIGKKKIYWCHADKDLMYLHPEKLSFVQKINKLRLQLGYQKYDGVWTVNDELTEGLKKAFRLESVATLSNPVDCASIIGRSCEEPAVRFSASKLNIVMVGRLSEEKGFTRVIDLLGKLQNDQYYLYILGEGPHREVITQAIQNNNLADRVTLMGRIENPYPYLKQAQLLISPSYVESFGLVMLEAMLLKVPVIATDTVGAREVTRNGQYATVVENTDDALGCAIGEFLETPHKYDHLIQDAYERALSYGIDPYTDKLLKLLDEQ